MATIKQKKAFKEVLNGSTISGAMKKAGYADTTATTTGKLTNTDGWKELLNKHLPDSLLAKVHREGLSASKKVFKNNNESGEIELVDEEADYAVRHKYLDSAYKLKGSYAPEKSIVAKLDLNTKSDPELDALRFEYEEKLKAKLIQ